MVLSRGGQFRIRTNPIGFRISRIEKKFIRIQSDFKSDPNYSDRMKIFELLGFGLDWMSLDFGLYFEFGIIWVEIGFGPF